ncbi:hypothetical protein PENSPDRAFT_654220 [Peniophora sp. CONT]|nr:hypothetical protein PENSPDRAFT_654220 [Peniophora sp. CONT]
MAVPALVPLFAAGLAAAQTLTFPATPLNQLSFPKTTNLPYQIYPDSTPYVRGPQSGYNICNSTTETQDSMCQTQWLNGLDDFCLWAPPQANSLIQDTEGEEVAWCTKKGWGTRIIVEGALQGAQLLKTKEYWMITGLIDQTKLNMQSNDTGGELDSGGQDERGNPIGGQMYSTAFNSDYQQIQWWTEFIGSNQFCIKICNPAGSNNPGYCQHTLDRIGLLYNCPSKYTTPASFPAGEFEICDSDLMTVPGIYVDASGATQSYAQPPESLGEITSIPYTPTVVASSNCQTFASSALFTELAAATGATSSASASGSAAASGSTNPSASGSASASRSASGSAAASAASGSASAAGSSSSGATSRAESVLSLLFSLAAGAFGVGAAISLLA